MKPLGVGTMTVLLVVVRLVSVEVEVTVCWTMEVDDGVMMIVGVLVIFCVAVTVIVSPYVVLPTLAFELVPNLVAQVLNVRVVSARTTGSTLATRQTIARNDTMAVCWLMRRSGEDRLGEC